MKLQLPSLMAIERVVRPILAAVGMAAAGLGWVASAWADEPRTAARRREVPPPQIVERTFKPVDQIQIVPRIEQKLLPEDCAVELFTAPTNASRGSFRRAEWQTSVYNWVPPEYFHRPLYFEQAPLERYGQSSHPGLQPALSGAHFFSEVVLLPYTLMVEAPRQWVSPLGYDRPGSYAFPMRKRLVMRPHLQPRVGVYQRPPLESESK